MISPISASDKAKYAAARRAVDFIENGMNVGLGSGSTAAWMVRCLGTVMKNTGLHVTAVATSAQTAALAHEVGIIVRPFDDISALDLTIDGADECDQHLNLIKGGGGALLREKIVAAASNRMIVIADASKQVDMLGQFALPVEIIPFGQSATQVWIRNKLSELGYADHTIRLRRQKSNNERPFQTDEGNFILDLHLAHIDNPYDLHRELNQIPGIVENGLFLDMCDTVIIGYANGTVEMRENPNAVIGHDRNPTSIAPQTAGHGRQQTQASLNGKSS